MNNPELNIVFTDKRPFYKKLLIISDKLSKDTNNGKKTAEGILISLY